MSKENQITLNMEVMTVPFNKLYLKMLHGYTKQKSVLILLIFVLLRGLNWGLPECSKAQKLHL